MNSRENFQVVSINFAKLDKPNYEVKRFPLSVKDGEFDRGELKKRTIALWKDPHGEKDHQTALAPITRQLFGFDHSEPVEIVDGWGADRLWFSIEVVRHSLWGKMKCIYTGYTSEVDFSAGELDPEMTLYFNTAQHSMGQRGVISTNQWTELSSEIPAFDPTTEERDTILEPSNMVGAIEVLTTFPDEKVIDVRALANNGRKVLGRNRSTLAGYLETILEGVTATEFDRSYANVAGAINKDYMSRDPFGFWLECNTSFGSDDITLGELLAALPGSEEKVHYYTSSVSETEEPEDNFNVQQRAEDFQPFVQELVNGLMDIGCHAGHLQLHTDSNGELNLVEGIQGDSEDIIPPEEHSWESYVEEVVVPRAMATFPEGYEGAKVEVLYSRVNTTRVTIITTNGRTVVKYPTFADNLTSPLVTRNYQHLYKEAEKLERVLRSLLKS